MPDSERIVPAVCRVCVAAGWRDGSKEVIFVSEKDKPILVGVDGTVFGRDALRWAMAEAEQRDCRVRALMVYQSESTTGRRQGRRFLGFGGDTVDSGYGRLMSRAVVSALGDRVQPRLTAELMSGVARIELTMASLHAQLVVLGGRSSGRTDTRSGKLTAHLLRHAACPVVVVPTSADQFAPPDLGRAGRQPVTYGTGPMF